MQRSYKILMKNRFCEEKIKFWKKKIGKKTNVYIPPKDEKSDTYRHQKLDITYLSNGFKC